MRFSRKQNKINLIVLFVLSFIAYLVTIFKPLLSSKIVNGLMKNNYRNSIELRISCQCPKQIMVIMNIHVKINTKNPIMHCPYNEKSVNPRKMIKIEYFELKLF